MTADQLRSMLRKQPFQPSRLYMSGGHSYDVSGPEWLMVTGTTTALGVPGRFGKGDIVILLDDPNITHTEPLVNGQPLA